MKKSATLIIGILAVLGSRTASAQAGNRDSRDKEIPVASRPPAGMCRIWLDSVPPAQQPAPTDCATAVRNRPAKGRVVFGDDFVRAKRESTTKSIPAIKGFAPEKSEKKSDKRPPFGLHFP